MWIIAISNSRDPRTRSYLATCLTVQPAPLMLHFELIVSLRFQLDMNDPPVAHKFCKRQMTHLRKNSTMYGSLDCHNSSSVPEKMTRPCLSITNFVFTRHTLPFSS